MRSKVLFNFAVIGLLYNFITNLITYFGINIQKHIPFMEILNIAFIIFFVVSLFEWKEYKGDKNNRWDHFLNKIKELPSWIKFLCVIFFIYEILNIVYVSTLTEFGSPVVINGSYVLIYNKTVRYIDIDEFMRYKIYELRISSGSWMFVYYLSATILHLKLKDNLYNNKKSES